MAASCNLGTDVGGTFTDLAWCTPSGELHCFKVPSTPSRPGQSILEGVDELFGALTPDSRDLAERAPHAQQHGRDQRADRAPWRAHRPDHHRRLPRRVRIAAAGDPASDAVRFAAAGTAGAARAGARGARAHRPGRRRTRTARRGGCGRGGARVAGCGRGDRGRRPDPQLSQSGARAAGARHRGAARTAAAAGTVQRDLAAGARVRAQRADRAERIDPPDRRGLSRSPDRGPGGARPRAAAARGAIEWRRRTGGHAARASGRGAAVGTRRRCRRCRRHGGGCRLDRGRSDDARCRRHQRRYRRDPRAAGRC